MIFEYVVKIPEERVAVLIGVKGRTRRSIERKLGIKLDVSSEGDVSLSGEDGYNLMIGQNIVKAIGRGFNPDAAMLLLKEDYVMDIIDITDYSGDSKKRLYRMRSRAIGCDGRCRELIEEFCGVHAVVYGKTIAIIGDYSSVAMARRAFEGILGGLRHATVYAMLEKASREKKRL